MLLLFLSFSALEDMILLWSFWKNIGSVEDLQSCFFTSKLIFQQNRILL
jgi:hypothetical protein